MREDCWWTPPHTTTISDPRRAFELGGGGGGGQWRDAPPYAIFEDEGGFDELCGRVHQLYSVWFHL